MGSNMPIFQDDFGGDRSTPPPKLTTRVLPSSPDERDVLKRKLSEESIRTELCEGPVLDDSEDPVTGSAMETDTEFMYPLQGTSDRVEYIERLKRGESPTWLPNRNLDSLLQDCNHQTPTKPIPNSTHISPLLPSPELERISTLDIERLQAGQEIERPRSALHSGDFTEGPGQGTAGGYSNPLRNTGLYSEPEPWLATSPPRNYSPFQLDSRFPPVDPLHGARSRAPSLSSSLSSSFVLKAPTSPLVQSESNDDLDFDYLPNVNPIDINPALRRNARRHTLQASQCSQSLHSTPSLPSVSNRPLPHLRRDNTYPYQAHQPRRSLTSNSLSHPASSPQTPAFLRSRRPSFGSDTSPLHHASMVGSYEESILRGRMSTTPSKPLDFVAQIGVLGLGKCKPNLRCPAHVTIPFPAVFYSYETTTHGRATRVEDGPSPYVGQIDLENNIPNPDEIIDAKRKRIAARLARSQAEDLDILDQHVPHKPTEGEVRRAEKQKRRSTSPRAPPGGSYRIPEKGQLQIVIKNPNKTAVKLFLVPYDLAGMEPGTKTFIRQRSYSAGSIVDGPISPQVPDRPTLRYLVHLHICSPSRGRFYLYKSIRLVFANRVPDGKEKLRNEISLPEPRFSVYKPGRDSNFGLGITSSAGANLAAEKAFRRRSSGFGLGLGGSNRNLESIDGIARNIDAGFSTGSPYPHLKEQSTVPVHPIPFSLYRKPINFEDDSVPGFHSNIQSPTSSKSSRPPTSPGSESSSTMDSSLYEKLNKGDSGYGGNIFTDSNDGQHVVAESLLAKKLRGVGLAGQQDLEF